MWMKENQVSLYTRQTDIIGVAKNIHDVIHTKFGRDINTICELRKLDSCDPKYTVKKTHFKDSLQLFAPSALLRTREKNNVIITKRTNIMQLDFDEKHIYMFDIEELKACVFSLPFIGFCGLSCSGKGFYALALIAEPERLKEYAEHCFEVLLSYGIPADTSKGRNPQDLRYVSYDANMLIRENPEPLLISNFKAKQAAKIELPRTYEQSFKNDSNALLNAELKKIKNVQVGERWPTVQKASYTIGGLNNFIYLTEINNTINSNPAFNGEEQKYLKCAMDCFNAGMSKPLKI